ncbi:MAG: RNA polymerase sigma factor [Bacteroidia bacterium]|nr:RNA polymerase sigma factor [Bacteroidia bacterium]
MKFYEANIQESDQELIAASLEGDQIALEKLIKKHQAWVYNIAWNMADNPEAAADITQEVLIRMITKLSTFKQESQFRTWLYRMLKNYFLNTKRDKYEQNTLAFEDFAAGLNGIRDEKLSDYTFEVEEKLLVKEAKMGCMKAMLLCLKPEQRMIYILGELFEFPDRLGGEIMEISRANFRIKLHRARKQLYTFMDGQCGLINRKNPCRCAKKTMGFIKKGYVNPDKLLFEQERVNRIEALVPQKTKDLEKEGMPAYQKIFQEHPFLKGPEFLEEVKALLRSKGIGGTFNLN